MATQDSPNLYERLGGVYSIATVVDDLIDRVMADPRLNANPLVDDAHHKVPPAGFKYLVTEMLCWAAGGPQKYTGKDMESSHRHLRITPGEWGAFMDDVAQTLDKFAVPAAERAEVVAIVESTRRSIIALIRGGSPGAGCRDHLVKTFRLVNFARPSSNTDLAIGLGTGIVSEGQLVARKRFGRNTWRSVKT